MAKLAQPAKPNLFFMRRSADHYLMIYKRERFCGTWDECEAWLRAKLGKDHQDPGQVETPTWGQELIDDSLNPERAF
jgi:hypothetical protein